MMEYIEIHEAVCIIPFLSLEISHCRDAPHCDMNSWQEKQLGWYIRVSDQRGEVSRGKRSRMVANSAKLQSPNVSYKLSAFYSLFSIRVTPRTCKNEGGKKCMKKAKKRKEKKRKENLSIRG